MHNENHERISDAFWTLIHSSSVSELSHPDWKSSKSSKLSMSESWSFSLPVSWVSRAMSVSSFGSSGPSYQRGSIMPSMSIPPWPFVAFGMSGLAMWAFFHMPTWKFTFHTCWSKLFWHCGRELMSTFLDQVRLFSFLAHKSLIVIIRNSFTDFVHDFP